MFSRHLSGQLCALACLLLLPLFAPIAMPAAAQGDQPLFTLDPSAITPAEATPAQSADPRLALATYMGGPSSDYGRAIAVDAQGNIFVAADTFAKQFMGMDVPNKGGRDVLVLKFAPGAKQLLAGVMFGSVSTDEVIDMVITPAGEPVLTILPGDAWPTHRALHGEPAYGNEGVLVKLSADLTGFVFSTYTQTNMSNSGGQNLAFDPQGNIYVTGNKYVGSTRARDLIVQKWRPDGQGLVYERVLDGDSSSEEGYAVAVTPDGSAYVTGRVSSGESDFSVTPDALQKLCGTELAGRPQLSCGDDGFLVILDPAGAVRYASYLGGDGSDHGVDIAVDGQGGIAIVGTTGATDFPTTPGALIPACKTEDVYGCYYDTFLTRLSPDGRTIRYSTFLNSNDSSSMDFTANVMADAQGNVVVTGNTSGEAFPVKDPVQGTLAVRPCVSAFTRFCYDTFVSVFGPDNTLRFSSYLGGTSDEQTGDIFLTAGGELYLTGTTESFAYPVTANAPQPKHAGGSDLFLAHIKLQGPGGGGGGDATPKPFKVALPLMRKP